MFSSAYRLQPARFRGIGLAVALIATMHSQDLTAQDIRAPFPDGIENARLTISSSTLNTWREIAAGAHVDEDIRFVLTGHQKGILASTLLFGPLGAIASIGSNEDGNSDSDILDTETRGEVVEIAAQEAIASELGRSLPLFLTLENPAASRIEIAPYVVLSLTEGEDIIKLHAMLFVELYESENAEAPIWRSRFYGEASGVLSEADMDAPSVFQSEIKEAFDRAAWGLARIMKSDFGQYKPVELNGRLVWMKEPGKIPFDWALLAEEPDLLLLRLPKKSNHSLWAGYHVVERDSVQYQPSKRIKDAFEEDFLR